MKTISTIIITMMATALLFLCSCSGPTKNVPEIDMNDPVAVYHNLAMTPPMGWNSWNIFQGEINEQQIKDIANAMVDSGMLEAGYEYLVIDDGWMTKERAENGELVVDTKKFPNGIKALSDYIHSKGLKFGIYECRGHSTCMGLPGSYMHEQIDMNQFARWGVDYLKLDSCYGALNGRKSSDDYRVYKECILKTGRPMILSMANFNDPSWAWEGHEIGHLWRTSMDIYPRMSSVYSCAETTAGANVIHPAFNGLWQFAGPGYWNDPDMLQVGNLGSDIESRTHFGMWLFCQLL
ncbi:MAG: glycoside hydrolase family 27 protein [Phycisphaerae bacterium]|nr:glycoside hydrolase family 27 protein [Phycisphaerae bacterium]